MKRACLTLTAATYVEAGSQLFNMRGADELLPREESLTVFETIAHIETYEPIPIFGGEELRAKMLAAQGQVAKLNTQNHFLGNIKSNSIGIAKNVQRGINTVTRTIGQGISAMTDSSLSAHLQGGDAQYHQLAVTGQDDNMCLSTSSDLGDCVLEGCVQTASLAIAAVAASTLVLQ